MKRSPHIFLSHSPSDREVARSIAQDLEGMGLGVWYDDQISAGSNFAEQVSKALEESDAMVVLLSPQYLDSAWNKREMQYALLNPRFANRLIPVLVRPSRDIPWILQEIQIIDGTRSARKVAADIAKALKTPHEVVKPG